jgi:hypothetical protein
LAAGQILFKSKAGAKNAMIYGIGLCIAALHDHRIPYNIVQFPDFLENPAALHAALRFPRPVQYDEFEAALMRVRQDALIHDRR